MPAHRAPLAVVLVSILSAACSASSGSPGAGGEGAEATGGPGSGVGGGIGSTGSGPAEGTCEEAAASNSYVGCDYWPTVVANNVWSLFDYAVVVANAGSEPADVTVTRGATTAATAQIPPNELRTLYLPWVPELKGGDFGPCTEPTAFASTVRADSGAYHLVSSRPVTVYQFSALEYAPAGGADGKDWNSCPGYACLGTCWSYSNDASLLLPTTALTGNYRITGHGGSTYNDLGGYFAVTGTEDATTVTVYVSQTGALAGGGGLPATAAGGQVTFTVNQGDVVELVGTPSSDLSGSLVKADKPVSVIAGMPCLNEPGDADFCDHVEESVFPAETWGSHYFVTAPMGPLGAVVGQSVRLYGNVDGTKLDYPGGAPAGAPTTLDAGQVVDLGIVDQDFEIQGDHELGIATFQLASTIVDPAAYDPSGDPSQSAPSAVEQNRTKYVFLAPADYDTAWAVVVQPMDADVTVDGAATGALPTAIGSGYGVARIQLGPGQGGAHVLSASAPVGLQVIGYGKQTSYQYPGGMNLTAIAPPPDAPK